MAFHVACPITCRKICFCAVGFPQKLQNDKGKEEFLEEVARVEEFLDDPWLIKARRNDTVQVKVPKVIVSTSPLAVGGDDASVAASALVKRVGLPNRAAVMSLVAEDQGMKLVYNDLTVVLRNNCCRFVEPLRPNGRDSFCEHVFDSFYGDMPYVDRQWYLKFTVLALGLKNNVEDTAVEEQDQSNTKIMCMLCYRGDNQGQCRGRKMLSCNSCGKKYHRGCVKSWSKHRDLFHWSSWTCPSCRTCEGCHESGDPNKLMFCKRCDAAYHCYCQQPPHKNVVNGPYLCPKHTKCHSCGSTVAGNGLSLRWFLGCTCCDACGRLFMKNNYCPVCLKVYRDSEAIPMVCCDICEKWVHCPCDGISEGKYMQFQTDGNLQYVCPMCRGDSRQIRSHEEAIEELWRRRDEAEKDVIASMRAAAGLPTHTEIFDISPFSDDEVTGPVVQSDFGRSLKFSLKGISDKSPKNNKKSGKKSSYKKSSKKKGNVPSVYNTDGYKNDEMQFSGEPGTFSPAGILTEGVHSVNGAAFSKHKYVEEIIATNRSRPSRTIKIKNNKPQDLTNKDNLEAPNSKPKTVQGPKLVIHLGASKNTAVPPRSNGIADEVRGSNKLEKNDGSSVKVKNVNSEVPKIVSQLSDVEIVDDYQSTSPKTKFSLSRKRQATDILSGTVSSDAPIGKRTRYPPIKYGEDSPKTSGGLIDDHSSLLSISQSLAKDRTPNLKFKISKNINQGGASSNSKNEIIQSPLPLPGKDDITYTRGQRSKRKRPEETSQADEDNTLKDFADANWILQKLGKDAAGKRVEIHHSSDDSWHRGTVVEVIEGTDVSIALDDGKVKNFKLGKQGIRFVSQKQKR